jgi:hypothetical protein
MLTAATAEPPARQIAIVRSYGDLHKALRLRADELGTTREAIDELTGLQNGYAAKLLAPVPIKSLGPQSLGPMLAVLGLKLLVVEDPDTIARITSRLGKRQISGSLAGSRLLAVRTRRKRRFSPFAASPEFAKLIRARQLLNQSIAKRKQIALAGAKARWRKPRVQEMKKLSIAEPQNAPSQHR